ncbi:YbjQ family protein [Candidatus Saccharibacteria bacterium]|nr:YbjQ family protein [Candidatus Saccharibacteria bacterium]
MIITTTDTIAGKTIKEVLGIVEGDIVMSKHIGSDITAGLRNIVGGEVKGYTDMLNKARKEAISRMIENAEKMDADAIVGMRYGSSAIMASASEMLAYGTAVKLK